MGVGTEMCVASGMAILVKDENRYRDDIYVGVNRYMDGNSFRDGCWFRDLNMFWGESRYRDDIHIGENRYRDGIRVFEGSWYKDGSRKFF